jgi:methylated-DNA-[protein]-cysteine S-methyltransferase
MKSQQGSSIFSAIVGAPFGAIGVRTDAGLVKELVYLPPHFGEKFPTSAVAELAVQQLQHSLADPDFAFDLPLPEVGSPFQR